jgi:hypothetical protein
LTSDDDPAGRNRRIAALEYQNRLLLNQTEALRVALAERDDDITRLSTLLLDHQPLPEPREEPSLLAWLCFRLRRWR